MFSPALRTPKTTMMRRTRSALAFFLLAGLAGCDSQSVEGPDLPTGPSAPTPITQTKTIRAMHVFGVGASEAANPFLVAEADTLRGAVVVNVWAEVTTDRPCAPRATCETVWSYYPLASRTTLRLSVPIVVDAVTVDAGSDLMPLLSESERASLITPLEQRSLLFAVRLDPARFSVPAGPVTVSMTWGTDSGPVLTDTTTFVFVRP